MDEQRAIELCIRHRDPVGFEFLVEKYRREAFMHAYALLGNQDDSLDACQDSFARAFAAIPQLTELTRFYPWFYCILRNHCLNLLARRQTSQKYHESQQQKPERDFHSEDPGRLLEIREHREQVQRAMQSLKPEHREILLMKYFQEHSYDEIASILSIPRGTVMSRLYHARTALREAWLKLDASAASQMENAR